MKYSQSAFKKFRDEGATNFVVKKYLPYGLLFGVAVPSLLLLIARLWIDADIPFEQITLSYGAAILLFIVGEIVLGILDWKDYIRRYDEDLKKQEQLNQHRFDEDEEKNENIS